MHAVDADSLKIGENTTPACMNFTLLGHTLARAVVALWYETEVKGEAKAA